MVLCVKYRDANTKYTDAAEVIEFEAVKMEKQLSALCCAKVMSNKRLLLRSFYPGSSPQGHSLMLCTFCVGSSVWCRNTYSNTNLHEILLL